MENCSVSNAIELIDVGAVPGDVLADLHTLRPERKDSLQNWGIESSELHPRRRALRELTLEQDDSGGEFNKVVRLRPAKAVSVLEPEPLIREYLTLRSPLQVLPEFPLVGEAPGLLSPHPSRPQSRRPRWLQSRPLEVLHLPYP